MQDRRAERQPAIPSASPGCAQRQLTVMAGTPTELITGIEWHPFGPRTQRDVSSGGRRRREHRAEHARDVNLRGQITRVGSNGPDATPALPLLDRSYEYDYTAGAPGPVDPGPNLDRVIDHSTPSESRFYFYDELDRLAEGDRSHGHRAPRVRLRRRGNRTSEVSARRDARATPTRPEPTASTSRPAPSPRDFAHDAYGNRIYDGPGNVGTPPPCSTTMPTASSR